MAAPRPRKSGPINKFSPKQHNADGGHTAKAKIRRLVLETVGKPAHVFDAFGGPGAMYSDVWKHADSYVGCDKEWYRDERMMFCADSARVLRALDLARFNIFDLDAYGSPYEQLIIVAARRKVEKGEAIGIVITDGTGLSLKMNGIPHAMAQLAGLRNGMVGVNGNRDFIQRRLINGLAKRMHCDVVKMWQAEKPENAAMRYMGLVLRGRG